jgi:hypothetical protein
VLVLITGWWTWQRFEAGIAVGLSAVQPFLWGGLIVGLVMAFASAELDTDHCAAVRAGRRPRARRHLGHLRDATSGELGPCDHWHSPI